MHDAFDGASNCELLYLLVDILRGSREEARFIVPNGSLFRIHQNVFIAIKAAHKKRWFVGEACSQDSSLAFISHVRLISKDLTAMMADPYMNRSQHEPIVGPDDVLF